MRQVEYFLAACETLNFTRAAESMDVSVPALTRAIRKLEDELGGQLFRRERHLTHLTDLGRLMQGHLSAAHAATEAARSEADRYQRADTGLRIGVIATMSASHLVAYLQRLREASPQLDLDIWESYCADIAQALDNAEIDLAIMSQPDYDDRFRPVPLYHEPYLLAFPVGHRLERLNQVPLAEIDGEDYIKRIHCEFPSNFMKLGIAKPYQSVRQRYATEREDWVQSMVAAGLGLTLMPKYLPILPGIVTRPIVDPEVTRTVSVVTRAGRAHSAAVRVALEVAREMDWEAIAPIAERWR